MNTLSWEATPQVFLPPSSLRSTVKEKNLLILGVRGKFFPIRIGFLHAESESGPKVTKKIKLSSAEQEILNAQ